jgi:hypothetical protein
MTAACGHWDGAAYCAAEQTRLYTTGRRCPAHTPSALLGRPEPEPDPGSTLAALLERAGRRGIGTSPAPTLVDDRAIASGRRRASPAAYRAAVAAEEERRQ